MRLFVLLCALALSSCVTVCPPGTSPEVKKATAITEVGVTAAASSALWALGVSYSTFSVAGVSESDRRVVGQWVQGAALVVALAGFGGSFYDLMTVFREEPAAAVDEPKTQ